jgi:hypothetical protein
MDNPCTSDHPLIDQYLVGLERDLAGRPDRHEVIAELRDHMLAAAESHERSGESPTEAERSAICGVGEPDLVARSFIENRRGVPAVPTAFTKLASVGGYAAAAGVLIAALGSGMMNRADDDYGWTGAAQAWYGVTTIGVLLLTLGLLVLLIGTVRRHGGLGIAGWFAIGIGAFGAFVSIAAWAAAVWAPLVAVSWLVALVATKRVGLAPSKQMAAVVVGLGALPLLIIGADELAQSSSGGTTLATVIGTTLFLTCVALVVTGAVAMARWLGGEVPVAPDTRHRLAT